MNQKNFKKLNEMFVLLLNPDKPISALKKAIENIAETLEIKAIKMEITYLINDGKQEIQLYGTAQDKYDTDFSYNTEQIEARYFFSGDKKFTEEQVKELYNFSLAMFSVYALKDTQKRLKESARTDFDTGISNARGFLDYGEKIRKESRENKDNPKITDYTVVYLNIRQFRIINQNYGFEVGNHIIKKLADRLDSFVKDDGIAGRICGDNFTVLLKDKSVNSLMEFINSLKITVKSHYTKEFIEYKPEYYIGIYRISEDVSMDIILERTTIACEKARKNSSLYAVEFSEEMKKTMLLSTEIESTMIESLENGEFKVYFQPKIVLKNDRLGGAEALVKWHKGSILITPDKFIQLFENNGFICRLDFYMLEQTCGYIKKWIADGLEIVPISVNFSKLHLLNPNFILNLCNVLDRYEVPHKYIEIELTETMFMTSDVVSISEIVLKLKENGFSVSIDDFGSGYSSLNLLKDIDADAIKLDKDFFNFRHPTHKERVIIESMTDMAKKINMRVICEGVETAEQADFLENIGCDLAQGFLYSKPVLAEDFEKKLYSGDYCYSRN